MDVTAVKTFEPLVDHAIRLVGSRIEISALSSSQPASPGPLFASCGSGYRSQESEVYKFRIGRLVLLGLKVLVAADIVKTIAHELTAISHILLAGLVLIRIFLSWTLVLEIDGLWPWQREPSPMSSRAHAATEIDAR